MGLVFCLKNSFAFPGFMHLDVPPNAYVLGKSWFCKSIVGINALFPQAIEHPRVKMGGFILVLP